MFFRTGNTQRIPVQAEKMTEISQVGRIFVGWNEHIDLSEQFFMSKKITQNEVEVQKMSN